MRHPVPPVRSRRFAPILTALALAAGITAQNPRPLTPQGPRVFPAPPRLLQHFDVLAGTVQQLSVPLTAQQGFVVDVVIAGAVRQVRLDPFDVRAPGFQLLVADQNGIHQVPTPPSVTMRGQIVGDPATDAAFTLVNGSLDGFVRMPQGDMWCIQPVRDFDPTAAPAVHLVYHSADNAPIAYRCGNATQPPLPIPGGFPDVNSICEIACEADYPYYQSNGSNVTSTQNDVTSIVNGMDVIYRRDVQIQYTISTILVRSSGDPYTTNNPSTLLNQFASQWNATMGSTVRDTAHLFTGRNILQASGGVIGIAALGVVCFRNSAYGLTQTRFTANQSRRIALISHEVGHNWGAQHCNSVPDCRIMCSGLGGCSGIITSFGPTEQSQILAFKAQCSCLTLAQTLPTITSAVPSSVTTFMPPQVTLTGTGFTGATQVHVGTATLTGSSFSVLSDTQLRFLPPEGLTIGAAPVTVTNAIGTGPGTSITYTATSPPELYAPPAAVGGLTLDWRFGGSPNHGWILLIGLGNQTAPWLGWPVLQGFTVLSGGVLDAAGIGAFGAPVPPAILNGVTIHSQVLEVDFAQLQLIGSTGVHATRIFL